LNKPAIISEEILVTEEVLAEPVILPNVTPVSAASVGAGPAYIVLAGISFSHFLNDTMQSLIASIYPILKDSYSLDFAQIGMITLAFQFTASLLQPLVGHFTDKKAQPFSLAIDLLRPAAARRRASIRGDPGRRRAGRSRLGGIPS
jgi:FSR family fosmidomycin resistance protein-like MFS transporter